MYYASFTLDQAVLASISRNDDPLIVNNLGLNNWQDKRSISFLVKKVDRPKIDLAVVESNQYNLRKYNYTKATFSDITMTLYDTSDNRVLTLWINYFRYYFNNSRASANKNLTSYTPTSQAIAGGFDNFQKGYGMSTVYGRNFFQEIGLYAMFGGQAQLTRLISPRISRIDWGTFDSTDSSPAEVTISFKYENIIYADDVTLTSDQSLLQDGMGFDNSGLDLPASPSNDSSLSRTPQPVTNNTTTSRPNPNSGAAPTYSSATISQNTSTPKLGTAAGSSALGSNVLNFGIS